MQFNSKIVPCLWFDSEGEDAARFYTGIFPNSRITHIERYPSSGQEVHGQPPGKVMIVAFELAGQSFTALNGGPQFKFTEAISLQVMCDSAEEVDHFWSKLGEGGPVEAQQCGWIKDRFGLSWQIVPRRLMEMLADPDKAKATRAFSAMLDMKKLELPALERAFNGQ
jgi:predicted 3-demethylubiquinone-9 3-methyltransferase (glyoxalase superfamily)